MELVFVGFRQVGGEIVDIEVELKPISIEDYIVLAYLKDHPKTKMATPYPAKRASKGRG